MKPSPLGGKCLCCGAFFGTRKSNEIIKIDHALITTISTRKAEKTIGTVFFPFYK